jgi:predicted RNA polymerase sigma factor
MPDEAEVMGLLALMLLVESRRATRTTPDDELVLLADQDRRHRDRGLIVEGQAIVRQCLGRNQPGPDQIQAAINAVHSDAPTAATTDWGQILQLYDQLLSLSPSPVVALHRAVAVAEVDGPNAALTLVDRLDLGGYHRSTPSAGTCSDASAATLRRRWLMTRRSPARKTRPSATSLGAGVRRSPGLKALRHRWDGLL